jgi:hypothetical protein
MLLNETELPRARKLNADVDDANLAKLLSENEDPASTYERTDIFFPMRRPLRIENALPA